MSAEPHSTANGKAPARPAQQSNSGIVNVQPARLDDLQPKYAQRIQHEEDNSAAHGWYAGLSKSTSFICVIEESQILSNPRLTITIVHGLGECLGFLGAIPCCVCCPNPYKPVSQGEVGLVTKFGRFVILLHFNLRAYFSVLYEKEILTSVI